MHVYTVPAVIGILAKQARALSDKAQGGLMGRLRSGANNQLGLHLLGSCSIGGTSDTLEWRPGALTARFASFTGATFQKVAHLHQVTLQECRTAVFICIQKCALNRGTFYGNELICQVACFALWHLDATFRLPLCWAPSRVFLRAGGNQTDLVCTIQSFHTICKHTNKGLRVQMRAVTWTWQWEK